MGECPTRPTKRNIKCDVEICCWCCKFLFDCYKRWSGKNWNNHCKKYNEPRHCSEVKKILDKNPRLLPENWRIA